MRALRFAAAPAPAPRSSHHKLLRGYSAIVLAALLGLEGVPCVEELWRGLRARA